MDKYLQLAKEWKTAPRMDMGIAIEHLAQQTQRLTDLVRYQRHELFEAKLISLEEFTALVTDSENGQRVARLEGYDEAIRKLQPSPSASILPPLPSERFWFDDSDVMAEVQDTEYARGKVAHSLMVMTCNEKYALYRAVVALARKQLNETPINTAV